MFSYHKSSGEETLHIDETFFTVTTCYPSAVNMLNLFYFSREYSVAVLFSWPVFFNVIFALASSASSGDRYPLNSWVSWWKFNVLLISVFTARILNSGNWDGIPGVIHIKYFLE